MRVLAGIAVALMIAARPAQAASPAVIGYLPAFKGFSDVLQRADLRNYTHINLAFVNPAPSGEIMSGSAFACAPAGGGVMLTEGDIQQFVRQAHHAKAKALISLGGGTIPACSGEWAALAGSDDRAKVIAGLLAFVDKYDLDGIDVDLEGDLMTRMDRDGNYTPFVQELGAALHSRSKLLTCATASYVGGMVPDASLPSFDLIGIMSYDAIGPTWGTPGDEHASYERAEKDLALWLGKGVPAGRLALGLPFYGHGFGQYRASWALRDVATEFGEEAAKSDVVGQRCPGCGYITFNGLPTLERKARLAGAWGAGVMVWEIDQDLPDSRAIKSVRAALKQGLHDAH